ncbi:MAG: hypothetical protein ACD_17C00512G0002 [uncultured bacterium]|nr:MAG: hypothetical protein ACD_17C00512G0002 [uncultured bacterium]HBA87491.1 hypothetical protein [Geobacter sp.]
MGAEDNLRSLVDACEDPNLVSVAYDAKKGAEYFKILTEKALLAFINTGMLEDPKYINTRPWELNPHKPPDIMVEAFSFYSGKKYGYIAFMFIPKMQKWRIKSFKKNRDQDPRQLKTALLHSPFAGLRLEKLEAPLKEK